MGRCSSAESSSDESCDSGEITASKLGKQNHWNEVYSEELRNFEEHGDEGEVWFGRDTLDRVLQWSTHLIRRHFGDAAQDAPILDVGTGNGTMLVGLAAQGFTNLRGNDYSLPSIKLARRILDSYSLQSVQLHVMDLIDVEAANEAGSSVSVVVDKGTLDAIGLSGRDGARAAYRQVVWTLLKPNGLLIVTSCNCTREELVDEFCSASETATHWSERDHVKTHPKFRFGGVEGSKVATVAFQRH